MVPSPRMAGSPEARTTAWAEPVPLTVLVTELAPLVKVTAMEAPVSPETVTTPPAWVASVEVAPLETPVPRARTGAEALVSKV
jgi:hypothetical protein